MLRKKNPIFSLHFIYKFNLIFIGYSPNMFENFVQQSFEVEASVLTLGKKNT